MGNMYVYPVEHICPTLHSDTLENSQHGKEDVVKVCDPAVGTLPLAPALTPVSFAKASTASKCARCWVILYYEPYSRSSGIKSGS